MKIETEHLILLAIGGGLVYWWFNRKATPVYVGESAENGVFGGGGGYSGGSPSEITQTEIDISTPVATTTPVDSDVPLPPDMSTMPVVETATMKVNPQMAQQDIIEQYQASQQGVAQLSNGGSTTTLGQHSDSNLPQDTGGVLRSSFSGVRWTKIAGFDGEQLFDQDELM